VNAGVDWTPMTSDFAEAFLVDPTTPTTVYMGLGCGTPDVASSSGGIRRSLSSGDSWEPAVGTACITALHGLPDGRVLALGATPEALPFFAISSDQGLTWQEGGVGIDGQVTGFTASSDGQTVYVATTLGLYKAVAGGL
jgi:dipeptidyl aminopeptidase/acylaminoacyl peptidase